MRAILRRISCARGCSANFGMVAPMVSTQIVAPRRPKSASRASARTSTSSTSMAPRLWPTTTISSTAAARAREHRLGKTIEARIDVRPAAMQVVVGADPIVQQLLHAPAPPGPAQQQEKDGNANRYAGRRGAHALEAHERDQQARGEPSAN